MRTLSIALLFIGCAAELEPAVFADLLDAAGPNGQLEVTPPPGIGPHLERIDVVQPATYTVLTVTDVEPGDPVLFVAGRRGQGAGPCSSGLNLCLDIRRPDVLGLAEGDNNGEANLSWFVPWDAAEGPLWVQAVQHGSGGTATTNVRRTDIVDVCTDKVDAFLVEAAEIRTCQLDTECGQVLTGTSCGCTRNWVARNNADTTQFYDLMDDAWANQCSLPTISTCDCPPTNGFLCDNGTCTWDYGNPPIP